MNRARAITGGQAFVPFSVGGTAATFDVDFRTGSYAGISGASAFTVTRTGPATSGTLTDATGSSYTSYPINTPRIVSGSGKRCEASRIQYLGVTDAPATQTTASLGAGTYTLWVIGSGSATSSAGTATITGGGAATAGTPNVFTVTVAGTVTVTVSGSLTRFQLENGAYATSYIPNHAAAGTSVTRGAENIVLTSTNFSSWYGTPTEFTIFCQFRTAQQLSVNGGLFNLSDVTGTSHRAGFFQTSGALTVSPRIVNTGNESPSASSAFSLNTSVKAALRVKVGASQGGFCVNGGTVLTSTVTALPTALVQAHIGDSPITDPPDCWIERVAFVPSGATDAQLQALTV